jgi:cytidine kinase
MAIDFVTIGEVTLDDTVLETGQVMRNQTGGGAVYSAIGVRLWGNAVGIQAVVGEDYPTENLQFLDIHQISTLGVSRVPGWSLRLWLLHEENNKKQQLPKLQSGNLYALDQARGELPQAFLNAKGYHLAPATTEGQMKARDQLRALQPDALISLDMLVAPFINLQPYLDGSAFRNIDILSPSINEIETLYPGKPLDEAVRWMAEFGPRWIAIKMDTRGSLVYDFVTGERYQIPICPVTAVDATGAGDAYSGGFLAGMAETGSAYEAGLRATVSASFAVEYWGAFGILQTGGPQVHQRLEALRHSIKLA